MPWQAPFATARLLRGIFLRLSTGSRDLDHALALTKSLPMLAEDYASNGASNVRRAPLLIRNRRDLIRAGLSVRRLR